ncbi:hypothetical protein ABPG73_015866 [Tetrahymena malaccensis]
MKNSYNQEQADNLGDIKEQLLYKSNQLENSSNNIAYTDKTQAYDFPQIGFSANKNYTVQNDINQQVDVIYSSSLKNSYDQEQQQSNLNQYNNNSLQNIQDSSKTLNYEEIQQQLLLKQQQQNVLQQNFAIPRTKTQSLNDKNLNKVNPIFFSSEVKQKTNQQIFSSNDSDSRQSKQFSVESFLKGKIGSSSESYNKVKQINEDIIKNMYSYQGDQLKEEEFIKKLYINSQFLKQIIAENKKVQNSDQQQLNQKNQKNIFEQNAAQVEVDSSQNEQQIQLCELQDEEKDEEDKLIALNNKEQNIQLNQLLSFKDEIKYQFKKIHFNVDIVQIRKKYRKNIFNYIVIATFFQFFVDNLISLIEQVVGSTLYSNQNQPFDYQSLSTKVTLYFAIFNVAFFPLLMGFIIDQIYSSIVMLLCLIVMLLGRILTLYSILVQAYQIRVLAQFFYQFGDSGFYLTSIYCIYFYYYDPKNTKKFVLKLTKYLGLGCSLPRNLSAIPMIFVYQASQNLTPQNKTQQEYNYEVEQAMPFLFDLPQKYIVFSLITALGFLTVYFGLRALYLDYVAHEEMSQKNFNYINNPLFKADIDDLVKNIFKNWKFIGVIFAGGLIYGLTSQNIIFNIDKNIYNQVNGTTGSPPNMTLFIIASGKIFYYGFSAYIKIHFLKIGHELFYIIFIWYFGKKISKNFLKKYNVWMLSALTCLIYYFIQFILSITANNSDEKSKFFILVLLFIINIFSGISFSTNVLCVDSILAKNIDKSCLGFAYSFMIVFKKLFELLGDLSLDFGYSKNLPVITFIVSSIALIIIIYIAKKSKQSEQASNQDLNIEEMQ